MMSIILAVALFSPVARGLVTPAIYSKHLSNLPVTLRSTTNDEEITVNPVVASVKVSKTIEVFGLVKQMEAEGETVTSLCVGEPDFPPPKAVLEAAMAAISGGDTKYTAVTGTAALRTAIASDLKRRKGLVYNPQTEIVVGNGVSVTTRYNVGRQRMIRNPSHCVHVKGKTIRFSGCSGHMRAW